MTKRIETILRNLPHKPGVYIHKRTNGDILYVGKAKDLRKRVQSYFRKSANLDDAKKVMVTKVADIETIVVDSEREALVLEATLLKKFKPPYNVALIDDKAYKFIKIDYTLDFPKIYTTRKVEHDGSRYFGPFTDGFAVMQTLQLLRRIFPYRTCNVEMSVKKGQEDAKTKYIDRPCLYYHIKKCDAPCVGFVSKNQYMKNIKACERFLAGNTQDILKKLREGMKKASDTQQYEEAAKLRDQIRDVEHVLTRQKVVSPKRTSYDVVNLVEDGKEAYINLFIVRDGKLMGRENFNIAFHKGTSENEILTSFVKQLYQKTLDMPKEIVVPEELEDQVALEDFISERAAKMGCKYKVRINVPKQGEKKRLLAMARMNAKEYQKRQQLFAPGANIDEEKALRGIAKAVGLKKPPKRIEIYDMSNIQGTSAVGSMVVFTDGKPDKNSYRRFKIATFSTPNDVGMMKEVLLRRLKRLKENKKDPKWPNPDLIVLDGGKPQHKAAREAMKELDVVVPFISLAKREEEVFVPGLPRPIRFAKDSQEMYLMQRMRDEAHRFAITYHRVLRSKKAYTSVLDKIPGLGPKKKKALLQTFGSTKEIAAASIKELEALVGRKVAKNIQEQLS